MRADLGFSETTLVWVVNAYLLTCGGLQTTPLALHIDVDGD